MDTTPTNPSARGRGRPPRAPERTPTQVINVEPPSSRALRTPLDRTASRDLLNSVRRGTSASGGRRNNAPTPHAQAARRELDQRRLALFTPGRKRRRSQMEQRQSLRDHLGDLARMLAPTSNAILSSSSSDVVKRDSGEEDEEDDDDDELSLDPVPPRPSSLIYEDDEPELTPHRPRLDFDNTLGSVEFPRERPLSSRFSRGSLDGDRFSDAFPLNDNTGVVIHEEDHSGFFPSDFIEDFAGPGEELGNPRIDDPTVQTDVDGRIDFELAMPSEIGGQTTMVMSEPASDMASPMPFVEYSVDEARAVEQQDDFFDNVASVQDELELFNDGGDIGGSVAGDFDATTDDISRLDAMNKRAKQGARTKRKRISRHGTEYPALPPAFVKRVAQTALQSSGLKNPRISADTLTALTQASEWFFEQLGDDLGAYADHARRKTIEDSDVATLMRRQRQVGPDSTVFSLAQKYLPRELLQDMKMPVPQPSKPGRGKRARADDDDAADVT